MTPVETDEERATRQRNGKIALALSMAFWLVTSGAIILVLEMNR